MRKATFRHDPYRRLKRQIGKKMGEENREKEMEMGKGNRQRKREKKMGNDMRGKCVYPEQLFLRDLRLKAGLTQRQTAAALGTSAQCCGLYERGLRGLSVRFFFRYMKLLGLHLSGPDGSLFPVPEEFMKSPKKEADPFSAVHPARNRYDSSAISHPRSAVKEAGETQEFTEEERYLIRLYRNLDKAGRIFIRTALMAEHAISEHYRLRDPARGNRSTCSAAAAGIAVVKDIHRRETVRQDRHRGITGAAAARGDNDS